MFKADRGHIYKINTDLILRWKITPINVQAKQVLWKQF